MSNAPERRAGAAKAQSCVAAQDQPDFPLVVPVPLDGLAAAELDVVELA